MAEPTKDGPVVYSRDIMGNPVKGTASATEALGNKPIGQQEAEEARQAQQNLSYVDNNWGGAGTAAMGAFNGLTLGLGPALAGVDPGHLRAAQTNPLYTAGDIGGMVAPALLSGGESLIGRGLSMTPAGLMTGAGGLAERLAGGILGDSAGLLGRMGSAPIRMAARGAAENALIQMGQATGDALINNKPLSAEAIAASGMDGALFGGLMGGTLGLVGSLGHGALESLGGATKKAIGGSVGKLGDAATVAKRLGMTDADVVAGDLTSGGRVGGFVKKLQEHGSDVGESTSSQITAMADAEKTYTAARKEAIAAAGKSPMGEIETLETRLNDRLTKDIVTPRLSTGTEARAAQEVNKFWDGFVSTKQSGRTLWNEANGFKSYAQWIEDGNGTGMRGTAKRAAYDSYKQYSDIQFAEYSKGFKASAAKEAFPKTWEGVIEARDKLANELESKAANPLMQSSDTIKREILTSLDSEIRESMAKMPDGIGDKYTAATQELKTVKELGGYLGKKSAAAVMSTGNGITGRDIAWFGTSAGIGHPAVGAGFLASKGIGKHVQNRFEPWMAQMAANNAFGVKAASATQGMQSRIGATLKAFFQGATKVPAKAAMTVRAEGKSAQTGTKEGLKYDRASYEAMATKAEQLVSDNHQAQVQKYAEALSQAGYTQLAQSILDVNHRAVMYTIHTMPPREAVKQLTSLRKQARSLDTSLQEKKTVRVLKGVMGGPHALLDGLEKGDLSRDQVQATAYVYPEAVNHFTQVAAQEIVDMKARGEFMPMDKIARLSVALNSPLDTTMSTDYIGAVQTALAAPDSQQKPQQPQGHPGGSLGEMGMAMMTPLQTITIGQQA